MIRNRAVGFVLLPVPSPSQVESDRLLQSGPANMINTVNDKQIAAAIRQSSTHHIDQPGYNDSNVIPFPMARVSPKAMENTQPQHRLKKWTPKFGQLFKCLPPL